MSTGKKHFVLTADDFGLNENCNRAILDGSKNGFLRAACICTNGESFKHAIEKILPECPELDLGVHLNIIEGKSLTGCPALTDKKGEFCHGFLSLLLKSGNKKILKEVENEFRAQIEKLKNTTSRPIVFINSHVHTHAIPAFFEITVRLAREYGIKYIRTQAEKLYKADKMPKPVNIVKVLVLNYFTAQNRASVKKYGLETNNYILGVGHTGNMNAGAIYKGVKSLSRVEETFVEVLIHPSDIAGSGHFEEYLASVNGELKKNIQALGFDVGSFSSLSSELHSREFSYKGV